MITTLFIKAILLVLGAILGVVPFIIQSISFGHITATITQLPFGIDAILVQAMGYIWFIVSVFPPLGIIIEGLLFVFGFKLALKLIAMIPIIKGLLYK